MRWSVAWQPVVSVSAESARPGRQTGQHPDLGKTPREAGQSQQMSSENPTLVLYLSFLSLVYFYFPVLSQWAAEKQPTSLIPGILISSPHFPEHGVSTVSYISLHQLHTGAASFLAQNQIFLVHLMFYIIRKTLFFCSRFPALHEVGCSSFGSLFENWDSEREGQ